jgi:hypothetical protein
MTLIEMLDNLKIMMEQANLSCEEAIEQARQLRGEDIDEMSMRVQVILDSCEVLRSQLTLVIDQGEDIQNIVGSG